MQTKTERLTVKLLQSDKRALKRMARNEGEAMAVVVRRLIRDAARQRPTESKPVPAAGQGSAHDRQ